MPKASNVISVSGGQITELATELGTCCRQELPGSWSNDNSGLLFPQSIWCNLYNISFTGTVIQTVYRHSYTGTFTQAHSHRHIHTGTFTHSYRQSNRYNFNCCQVLLNMPNKKHITPSQKLFSKVTEINRGIHFWFH